MDRLRVAQVVFALLGVVVLVIVGMRACDGGGGDDGPRLRRIDTPAEIDPEFRDNVGRQDVGTDTTGD